MLQTKEIAMLRKLQLPMLHESKLPWSKNMKQFLHVKKKEKIAMAKACSNLPWYLPKLAIFYVIKIAMYEKTTQKMIKFAMAKLHIQI